MKSQSQNMRSAHFNVQSAVAATAVAADLQRIAKRYLATLLLVGLIGMMGCGKKAEPAADPESVATEAAADLVTMSPEQVKSIGIATTQVSRRVLHGKLAASGVLDVPPQNLVSISAPFGGFLQSTPLLQGSHVTRGQQIALLQDPEFVTMQQQYLEDRSQLTYLAAEYERQQTLAAENVNARKSLEKSKADWESMKARIAGQRAKLEMLNIDMVKLDGGQISKSAPLYAPISGFVTQVHVNIGSHVNPEDVLFKIADTGHLHAELTVYEQDLPMIAVGQSVRLRLSNENVWRTGEIHLIGREIGEDRTVKIHVHLDAEDTQMVPGTYLQAEIEAVGTELIVLPNNAIVQFDGKYGIFIQLKSDAAGQQFQMVPLEIGIMDSAYTQVMLPSTFNVSSTVVTTGSYGLLSKLKNTEEE